MTALHDLSTWWHPAYIEAARSAYPAVTKGHELAVGWKLTSVTGRTHGGYHWPLVDGDHDLPVLHECDDWNGKNRESCPSREGDGFCLVTDAGIASASSGGQRLACSTGHVLVYPADLAEGDERGKWRVPWVVDVDCLDPLASIRGGYVADLSGANLYVADLTGAVANSATVWPVGFAPRAAGVILR